jgi:hypothetical protein
MTQTHARATRRAPISARAVARRAAPRVALALAATLVVCVPAHAEVHKCQGPKGVITYSDAPCPGSSEVTYAPRELLKAPPGPGQDLPPPRSGPTPPATAGTAAAGHVPDAPAPAWDTHLGVIEQIPGRSAWLDADTLAVTTYGDPKAPVGWMVRKVVAADARTHAIAELVPRGFLDCTNPDAGLVGIHTGTLEGRFAVRSNAPPPVQRFLQWDAARHAAAPAAGEFASGWHAASCLKPAPEDLAQDDWWEGARALRYLQPKDGLIHWGMVGGGRPEGPSLQNGTRKTMLDATTDDIARHVRHLPWRKAYQLSPGRYTAGTRVETPLVVMATDGRITRTAMPAALRQQLDALNPSAVATTFAVKPGLLVQVPGAAAFGGGLYLAQGAGAKRLWCVPGAGPEAGECRIAQDLEFSPDGCKVAFDARAGGGLGLAAAQATMRVIDVCAAAGAATSARR